MYVVYGGQYTRTGLVLMVLEHAGVDYQTRHIDVANGEHRRDAYLAINPAGYVPALRLPQGEVLHEACAIALYLCEHHGLSDWVPTTDDPQRGRFLSGYFYISNEIQPEIKRYYFPDRFAPYRDDAPIIHQQAYTALLQRFAVIDQRLRQNGPWYLGARFSLVDLVLAFWATSVHPQQELFAQCPAIEVHCERVVAGHTCARHIVEHRESSQRYWQQHLCGQAK